MMQTPLEKTTRGVKRRDVLDARGIVSFEGAARLTERGASRRSSDPRRVSYEAMDTGGHALL